jgi:hypothetical protein
MVIGTDNDAIAGQPFSFNNGYPLCARIRFGIRFGFGVKDLHGFFNSDSNSCG